MPKCPICGRDEISQDKYDKFMQDHPDIAAALKRAGVNSIVELTEKMKGDIGSFLGAGENNEETA